MTDDLRKSIYEHGNDLARLHERFNGMSARVEQIDKSTTSRMDQLDKDKVDRREYAPVKWLGIAIGTPMIATLVVGLMRLLGMIK